GVLRVLLGFAEAVFFPGMILYLTDWVPAPEPARAVAVFMIGAPVTRDLGGPPPTAVIPHLDGRGGLPGACCRLLSRMAPRAGTGLPSARVHARPARACAVADPGGTELVGGTDQGRGGTPGSAAQPHPVAGPVGWPRLAADLAVPEPGRQRHHYGLLPAEVDRPEHSRPQ